MTLVRMRSFPFGAALGLSLPFAACSSDPTTGTAKAGVVPACGASIDPTCPNPPPSYKKDVAPVLDAKCNNCHDGHDGGPWPLGSVEDIQHWRGQVLGDLIHCTMPPADAGAALSPDERAALIGWLACKSPNN